MDSKADLLRDPQSFSADLRGFGPIGLLAILGILLSGNIFVPGTMIVVPVGAVLVLIWARWSRTPWREIGYVRPASWIRGVVIGIVLGSALKLLMKAIVMPLLGADPINQAYHFLAGNSAMLPAAISAMFVAGFGEETLFRGYMFERLGKLLGTAAGAKAVTVAITTGWFGLAHYGMQGFDGVAQATIVGLIFGAIYARTRTLWMLMWAHTTFDLMALAIIYLDLERDVAHLVFS